MLFTSRIDEAIKLASHLHRDQVRKDLLFTPYSSHLFSVAMILATVTDDEDIIIAGLLHDSLEDVPLYTYDKLVEAMGIRVANIVLHVTEPLDANRAYEDQLPWLTRKEKYLENLALGGIESALVSCADKIHNTENFILDAEKGGEDFFSHFGSSLRNKLWFHQQVLAIVREKLGENHVLVERLVIDTEEFAKLTERED